MLSSAQAKQGEKSKQAKVYHIGYRQSGRSLRSNFRISGGDFTVCGSIHILESIYAKALALKPSHHLLLMKNPTLALPALFCSHAYDKSLNHTFPGRQEGGREPLLLGGTFPQSEAVLSNPPKQPSGTKTKTVHNK